MSTPELSKSAERIAFATSNPGTALARWTELAVYFDHDPVQPGRPWIAVSKGVSTFRGERTKEEAIAVGTLDRALKLFDDRTGLGRSVIAQAEDWRERHVEIAGDMCPVGAQPAPGFDGEDQAAALRWLYGDDLPGRATHASLLAKDFGLGERTVQTAMKNGSEIRIPLVAAMRFFDRDAFLKAREAARG